MNYGKQGLKVLGLSLLAALGLMAFGPSGASASGLFLIEGLEGLWEAAISGEGENLLTGRFWVLGLNFEIFCHAVTLTGKATSHGHGHATLTYSNCLVSGTNPDGTLKGPICKLNNNITAQLLFLVFLHTDNKPYLLFTPLDGLTYAVVNGAPCLPNAAFKGSFVASISNPDEDNVVKLISTKGMLSLFPGDIIRYGINETHLDFDALISLSGVHTGFAWGAA